MPKYRIGVCLEVGGFVEIEAENAEAAEAIAEAWLDDHGDLPDITVDIKHSETTNREFWAQDVVEVGA